MNHDFYSDDVIRAVLARVKTIAMLGASPNPSRPSFFVFKYLRERGYQVFPVNPGQTGKELLGQPFHASLADIACAIDMVDVFRGSEYLPAIVDEVLALSPRPSVIWTQLGVRDDASAARAEAAGITVIMNRCPKIEIGRLSSEIGWMGVNSRTLSARRAPPPEHSVQKLSLHRSTIAGGVLASQPKAETPPDSDQDDGAKR